jgi:RHS repeat-associated protein
VDGYNEETTYDWNGNILSMKRNAVISGTVSAIDDVTYSYGTDDNKLSNVTESSSNTYGFRNITSSSSGYTYTYGNLTADAKKGTTITYNEMNKPVTITQTSTGKYIQYSYDAAGTRLTKKVYDGSTTKTYYYIAGLVYDGTTLSYFAMAEGRVRHSSGTFTYEYFITDQQGNVRVSFEDNGSGTATVSQETSYYPFGMLMPGNYMPANANKRLYNAGSEWQDDIDGVADYYSTFFREYDPTLGRFNSVDPEAESSNDLSVYHYSNNNPINCNDPLGNDPSKDYGLEWADIIAKFRNSAYGGHWSPSTGADKFETLGEAIALGNLASLGFNLNFFFQPFGYNDVDLKQLYTKRYQEINSGKRDFKFSLNASAYATDLNKIANVKVGAALLAFLDIITQHTKIFIDLKAVGSIIMSRTKEEPGRTIPNTKDNKLISITIETYVGKPIVVENVLTPSYVILGHELWHAADYFTGPGSPFPNFVLPFNTSNYPSQSELQALGSSLSSERMYREIRAVGFENAIREPNTPWRLTYGVPIGKWLLTIGFMNWTFQ